MNALSDLIRPWDGLPVSVPGAIAGLAIEKYHGDICNAPSISSTGLRRIRQQSPAHFFAGSYLNPEREPEAPKDHFNLGQAAHMLFLGEEGFADTFVLRPDEYPDRKTGEMKPWHSGATYCKDWSVQAAADGKRVLTSEQLRQIRGMSRALAECGPVIDGGILNGLIETSLVWKDAETGVWLKARPDVIPTDGAYIADLKTTQDAHPSSLPKTIASYGYHVQLALIGEGMRETLGIEVPDAGGYSLVFVETGAPHGVSIVEVDHEDIAWGRREVRAAVRLFADCLEKGRWPAYPDIISVVSLPAFYRERLFFEAAAGLLPEAA